MSDIIVLFVEKGTGFTRESYLVKGTTYDIAQGWAQSALKLYPEDTLPVVIDSSFIDDDLHHLKLVLEYKAIQIGQ